MSPAVYLALVAAALLASSLLHLDRDPGPAPGERYPFWDRWSKWHLGGSALLAGSAVALGVPLWPAILITVLAGIGWEFVNGYVSSSDIILDIAGALGGGLLASLIRHSLSR